jgi:Family of unknown function (DUF5989)
MHFLKDIFGFVFSTKKYWLMPVLIVMIIFGSFVILTKGSLLAPFIYTVF